MVNRDLDQKELGVWASFRVWLLSLPPAGFVTLAMVLDPLSLGFSVCIVGGCELEPVLGVGHVW